MDRLDTINAFVHVASMGSFVSAADRLDLSPQLVSKYVANLEERIGARLLNRTTRQVRLTEAGERFLVRAQQLLTDFHDMENEVDDLKSQAQGTLRINAPVSFAERHLAPLLFDFQQANPGVDIDLQLNDRRIDIVDEGFDIALRIGVLKESSFIAKRLAPVKMMIVASPGYLKKKGTPQEPEDLINHTYLHYSNSASLPPTLAPWLEKLRKSDSQQFVSNNGDVLTNMALQGAGIALVPSFICSKSVADGKLVTILKRHTPPPTSLYAMYAHRQLLASKVRYFIDFAAEYYGDSPYWD